MQNLRRPGRPVDYLAPDVGASGLGRRAARGTAITLIGQWAGFVLQTLSTVVLARLLTPADFGLVAGVLVVTGLAELLKDLGLGAATVQRRELTGPQLNTLFWVNAGLGVVTAAAVAASAPLVAAFYDQPAALRVTLVLAIAFLFSGISVQHQALLSRTLQFRSLTAIDLGSRAAGLVGAVALAVAGGGYWALVASPLITAIARWAALWTVCAWRPGRPRWAADMGSLLSFGGWTSGFGIVNYASRNADNALIGRYVGAADLGIYSRAYQLLLLPLQQVNMPISRVVLPTLSRLQGQPERFRRFYQTAMTAIAYVALPAVALMAVLAHEIVDVMLGPGWDEAAPLFQVLAVAGVTMTLGHANGWLYQATGHARRQAIWGVVSRTLTIAAFVAGLPWGPYGVAVAYAVSSVVLMVPGFALATRGTPVAMRHIVAAVWRPALVALVTFAVSWVVHRAVVDGFPLVLVLATTGVAALTAYAGLVTAWPTAREQWRELAGVLQAAARPAR
jgi:PST family polysaccharide transporter